MLVGRTGLTLVLCSGRNLYWIIRVLFKLVLKFFIGWSSFYPDNWAPLVSWITFQGSCSPQGRSTVAAWKWNGPHLTPASRSGKPSAKQEAHSDLFVDFWKFLPAYLPTSLVLCHEHSCHPSDFSLSLSSANLSAQPPESSPAEKSQAEEKAER